MAQLGNGDRLAADASLDQRFSVRPRPSAASATRPGTRSYGQGREFMYKYTSTNTVSNPDGIAVRLRAGPGPVRHLHLEVRPQYRRTTPHHKRAGTVIPPRCPPCARPDGADEAAGPKNTVPALLFVASGEVVAIATGSPGRNEGGYPQPRPGDAERVHYAGHGGSTKSASGAGRQARTGSGWRSEPPSALRARRDEIRDQGRGPRGTLETARCAVVASGPDR